MVIATSTTTAADNPASVIENLNKSVNHNHV